MSFSRALLSAAAAAALFAAPAATQSAPPLGVTITDPGQGDTATHVKLSLNKSTVIELERPAADVVITNPAIADAVVQTANRIIFRGVAIGQTNAIIFDKTGRQIVNLDIGVEADTALLEDIIAQHVPDARVSIQSANGKIVLSGFVDDLAQMSQVTELISAYAEGEADILNLVEISAKDQVLLQVKIIEMQRGVTKQLGIDLSGTTTNDNLSGTISSVLGFNATGGAQGGLIGNIDNVLNRDINGDPQLTLNTAFSALERIGLSRTLAEPNIVAISGETGEFLAGGEFPIPVSSDANTITVEFRQFGVSLAFTPIVLSEGRISLQVSTEVSELSSQGSVSANGIIIPALTVRRVDSVVEIPSGGSMMLAGLIQSRSRQGMDQLPGISNVPVLGALFQSRDFVNDETELVVVVTPYLVDPARPQDLRSPDAGYVLASDLDAFLFGKLNDIYGQGEDDIDPAAYQAPVGFIEE